MTIYWFLKVSNIRSDFTDYVVSVSQSKKYLFSFMTKKNEDASSGNMGNAFINVIDIQRETVIARVQIDTGEA